MTPMEGRAKCLELAVAVAGRRVENDVDAIVEISRQFYNHIAIDDGPADKPGGLTSRVDKQVKGLTAPRK